MDQAIATVVVAATSAAVTITIAVIGYIERSRSQREQTLLNALSHLTGGSQERSVGIALIEGMWHRHFPSYPAILPALTNQAVYLLLETKSKDGRHQFHSWVRIMQLILRAPFRDEFRDLYIELVEALDKRVDDPDRQTGVAMSVPTARIWRDKVAARAHIDSIR